MKRTIRNNIIEDYSLHDMNVIEFEVNDNNLNMKTQSGMCRAVGIAQQVNGYVEFHDVDWDFCHAYILDTTANTGTFTGEKMYLKDFIDQYKIFGFSIIDEVYGYNQTKYWGFLSTDRTVKECIIEIYHLGDMIFVEE